MSEAATRFGIVGCGGAALPVGEAITASPLTDLVAVYDVDPRLARDLAERFGCRAAATLAELLADPQVAAVYIAVPHHLLAPLTRQALEAGKHALVEKPLAIILADADAVIALAEARGLALGVFYELRHATAVVQARALVQAGAIGDVIGVRVQTLIDKPLAYWESGLTGRSASPWRGRKAQAGGGVVLMNTSHALDALRQVTGLEVVSVAAEAGTLVAGVEVEDTAAAVLRFDNGAIGSLFAGAHLAGGGDECFDVYGTRGQLRLPDLYGPHPLRAFLRQPWGDLAPNLWHDLPAEPAPVYVCAVEAFARAVQRGRPAPTDGRAARRVLATVLALYRSATEKRTITLSLGEAIYA